MTEETKNQIAAGREAALKDMHEKYDKMTPEEQEQERLKFQIFLASVNGPDLSEHCTT